MEVEIYSIVATVILSATLLTALFALATYVVFQIRKRRRKAEAAPMRTAPAPQFFRRYGATQ